MTRPLSPTSARRFFDNISNSKKFAYKIKNFLSEDEISRALFFLSHAKLTFNFGHEFDKAEFLTIDNLAELKDLYLENFPTDPFVDYILMRDQFCDSVIDTIKKASQKADLTFKKDQQKLAFKPLAPIDYQLISLAPQRYSLISKDNGEVFYHTIIGTLQDQYLAYLLKNIFAMDLSETLAAKFSISDGASLYITDRIVVLGDKIYHVDEAIFAASKATYSFSQSSKELLANALTDLTSHTINFEKNKIPFLTEGGDILEFVDKSGKKTVLFSLSDAAHNLKGVFRSLPILTDEATITQESDMEKAKEFAQKWFESIGYESIVVTRNTPHCKFKDVEQTFEFNDLYHLDVFAGVLKKPDNNYVLVIAKEDVISRQQREELYKLFPEGNVIEMTKEEREKLCSNFRQAGNCVIMTLPDTPKSFKEKVEKHGFNCIIPEFSLGRDPSDGTRCSYQNISQSSLSSAPYKGVWL